MKIKLCPKCGKKFSPTHGLQKYCVDCQRERVFPSPIKKKCEMCGKEMLLSGMSKRRRFCHECVNKKSRERQHKYYLEVRKKKRNKK